MKKMIIGRLCENFPYLPLRSVSLLLLTGGKAPVTPGISLIILRLWIFFHRNISSIHNTVILTEKFIIYACLNLNILWITSKDFKTMKEQNIKIDESQVWARLDFRSINIVLWRLNPKRIEPSQLYLCNT